MSKKLIAAALAASLAASAVSPASAAPVRVVTVPATGGVHTPWVPFAVMGCASGIILAAMAASSRDKRELTAPEAWTCGLLFLFSEPRSKSKAKRR